MNNTQARRAAAGVCVRCGGPRDDPKIQQCSACRRQRHDVYRYTYQRRCRMGICVNCGRKDSRTTAGLTLCQTCAEKQNASKRKRRRGARTIQGGNPDYQEQDK